METAHDTAFEQGPEALNRLSMDGADNVLADAVVNGRVRELLVEMLVSDPLIGAEQANLCGHGLTDEFSKGGNPHILNVQRRFLCG